MNPTGVIAPINLDVSVPSLFSPDSWAKAIGTATSTVEGWFGQNGVSNSATAVAAATLPGQPSTTAAASTMSSIGSVLLSPVTAIENLASSAASSVESGASSLYDGTVGVVTGTSSLIKWIVVGLVAVAIIYVISQLRMLEI